MDKDIVFTTESILNGMAKIAVIYHDEDDTWQALPLDDFSVENGRIIAMSTLLKLDSSIKEILTLDKGYKAVKEGEKWIIYQEI